MTTLPNSGIVIRRNADLSGSQIASLRELDQMRPGSLWDLDVLEKYGVAESDLWIQRESIQGEREQYLARNGWLPSEFMYMDDYGEAGEYYVWYTAPDYCCGFIVYETVTIGNNQLEISDITVEECHTLAQTEEYIRRRCEEIASEVGNLLIESEDGDD